MVVAHVMTMAVVHVMTLVLTHVVRNGADACDDSGADACGVNIVMRPWLRAGLIMVRTAQALSHSRSFEERLKRLPDVQSRMEALLARRLGADWKEQFAEDMVAAMDELDAGRCRHTCLLVYSSIYPSIQCACYAMYELFRSCCRCQPCMT